MFDLADKGGRTNEERGASERASEQRGLSTLPNRKEGRKDGASQCQHFGRADTTSDFSPQSER